MSAPAAALGPTDLGGMFDRHARELLRCVSPAPQPFGPAPLATHRVGEQIAEDIVAQTFLIAYEQKARYDPARGEMLPWLYGICTNLLRRHRRDEIRALKAVAGLHPDTVDGPTSDRVDAQRLAAKALAALSRRQRDVLLLYAVAELEYGEIAVALGMPLGTVQSTLHRARAKVRAALGGPS